MIKSIIPAKEAINEVYCDVCQELIEIAGIPDSELPVLPKQIVVAMSLRCGHNSKYEGLCEDIHFCNTCGDELIGILKEKFKLKLSIKDDFEGAQ
jgi:hypothetical protein